MLAFVVMAWRWWGVATLRWRFLHARFHDIELLEDRVLRPRILTRELRNLRPEGTLLQLAVGTRKVFFLRATCGALSVQALERGPTRMLRRVHAGRIGVDGRLEAAVLDVLFQLLAAFGVGGLAQTAVAFFLTSLRVDGQALEGGLVVLVAHHGRRLAPTSGKALRRAVGLGLEGALLVGVAEHCLTLTLESLLLTVVQLVPRRVVLLRIKVLVLLKVNVVVQSNTMSVTRHRRRRQRTVRRLHVGSVLAGNDKALAELRARVRCHGRDGGLARDGIGLVSAVRRPIVVLSVEGHITVICCRALLLLLLLRLLFPIMLFILKGTVVFMWFTHCVGMSKVVKKI
eukprot:PhM_4_TR15054/c0_g1_i1/m.50412